MQNEAGDTVAATPLTTQAAQRSLTTDNICSAIKIHEWADFFFL